MKSFVMLLSAAGLLAGCNQTAPGTSAPTVAAPDSAAAPAAAVRADSAIVAAAAPPTDGNAAAPAPAAPAPAAPLLKEAETLKVSFRFKPLSDSDNPRHPLTSAHLLLQGGHPMDIDLGKFAGKPDVVDAVKAKQAGFPGGMLLGFRSYEAATGISQDLAVLSVDGNRLRIVQRHVAETAPEGGQFETSREVPLPENTVVVAAPVAKK